MAKLKPKGKALNSFNRLKNVETVTKLITNKLSDVYLNIRKIIDNENNIVAKNFVLKGKVSLSSSKQKSNVKDIPNRIEFEILDGFIFYIDFTIETSKQDQKYDIKGSIIYGTNRSLCFTKCLYPETMKEKKDTTCYACDRIGRCDKFEDKPLLKFSVDRDGMIQSPDKFEDKLWMFDDKNSLLDLHYQAIDHIWEEAVYWTNENLLP